MVQVNRGGHAAAVPACAAPDAGAVAAAPSLNVASSAGLLPGGPYMAGYYASKAYGGHFRDGARPRSCGKSAARCTSVPSVRGR